MLENARKIRLFFHPQMSAFAVGTVNTPRSIPTLAQTRHPQLPTLFCGNGNRYSFSYQLYFFPHWKKLPFFLGFCQVAVTDFISRLQKMLSPVKGVANNTRMLRTG